MTKSLFAADPFSAFSRFTLGFDDLFRDLEQIAIPTPTYPPYNLIREDEERYRIEVAVAGFTEEDLQVYLKHGRLTIATKAKDRSTEPVKTAEEEIKDMQVLAGIEPGAYIHKGIAKRDFTLQFRLNDSIEIESAKLQHGMLIVQLATLRTADDVKRIAIETI